MSLEQQLDVYLRARFTLIVLVTAEEERALAAVRSVCDKARRPALAWDAAEGNPSRIRSAGSAGRAAGSCGGCGAGAARVGASDASVDGSRGSVMLVLQETSEIVTRT